MNSIKSMFSLSRSRIKLVLEPDPEIAEDTIVSLEKSPDFKKWLDK